MRNIIIALSGTFRPKGGMTSSALKKASMLADYGHNVTLVTFHYRLDQVDHERELIEQHLLSKNVKIVNFYQFLDSLDVVDMNLPTLKAMAKPDKIILQQPNEKLRRYFSNQGDLLYTEYTKIGPYPHIHRRYYDVQLRLERTEELGLDLTLKRVRRFLPDSAGPISESFISSNGNCYLTIWYRTNGSVRTVIDLSKNGRDINPEYSSVEDFQAAWFKKLVSEISEGVLIIDSPQSFDITQQALSLADKRILTLHSNTFSQPDDISSKINSENLPMINRLDLFEHVVASTMAQCEDLKARFPDKKFTAIPQLVTIPDRESVCHIKRDVNLIVYVGRLEPLKQLDELLNAIAPLFRLNPLLRFEIYGVGSLESTLKDSIGRLQLDHAVKLMGRTEQPMEVFARANVSVLPTKNEGFGLVIAESMMVGTPVVAFDCRYGPSEMIDHNVTGRLATPKNFAEFAECLSDLLSDQKHIEDMRDAARSKIKALCSADANLELWNKIIQDVPSA